MDRVTGRAFATRSEVAAQHGMACTSQPLATQVALDLLKQGGSAVDAAIAANAALGLMEPTGAGLGGDLFAIVWDAGTRKLHGLNASGRSPRSLTLEHFRQLGIQRIPPRGPLPVSVPGAVDGWFELHGRFGRLPMKTVLAPVIRYADEGFPVSEVIAWDMAKNMAILGEYPGFRETYSVDGIRAPRAGEVWRNPRLARTLDLLAEGGRDAFYRGVIAREIDAYLKAQGGFLSFEDLASHQGEWVDPVSVDYRGYDVWALPGNGQGIAVLQMLNILEGYDFSRIPFGSPRHVHLFTEAKKLVFEDRAKFYGDPAFVRVPVRELLSKTYAARRRALIDEDRASLRLEAGNPALEDGDTVYLTVADRDGTMVSLIQSNFRGMGSGMTPGLGFCLQDRGELFSLEEGQANTYAPGKRPFHTIIPGFMEKGNLHLGFGIMGGLNQAQAHAQFVSNVVDRAMNLQAALESPRFTKMTFGGCDLVMEGRVPAATRKKLARKGHRIEVLGDYSSQVGGGQAVMHDAAAGVNYGASDPRKDGAAVPEPAGYF
jgi:gamma-glutamyltranspeptidase/glutathione hydrolase